MFGTLLPVSVGALTFDVWTAGPVDGEPVVLLHGFPQSAAGWALVAPSLIEAGLRVIAPNQRGYSAGARQRLRAMYGNVVPADQVEEHVRILSEPGALTAALNWYRAMTAELGELPSVTVPTTYVWSDHDIAIGRSAAENCGAFVDAPYEFVELEGISHWIPEEAPLALATAILDRVTSD